jgi:sirohydrochlorin cobaltochelatase
MSLHANSAGRRAIVLFAHGSRDPLWHRPMQSVAQSVQATAPDALVACAYLELSTPDLPTAISTLVAQGASDIAVLPMFLGVGKHAREDLPGLVEAQRQRFPSVQLRLRPAVGEDARLVQLLAEMALESLSP